MHWLRFRGYQYDKDQLFFVYTKGHEGRGRVPSLTTGNIILILLPALRSVFRVKPSPVIPLFNKEV